MIEYQSVWVLIWVMAAIIITFYIVFMDVDCSQRCIGYKYSFDNAICKCLTRWGNINPHTTTGTTGG